MLAELRSCIARLEQGRAQDRAALPFGVPSIDSVLPGGGLAFGALHEVAGGGDG
ncbi:damage-inducible protein, partial [Amaricoccus sp. HAR-UPW-R2A-40]